MQSQHCSVYFTLHCACLWRSAISNERNTRCSYLGSMHTFISPLCCILSGCYCVHARRAVGPQYFSCYFSNSTIHVLCTTVSLYGKVSNVRLYSVFQFPKTEPSDADKCLAQYSVTMYGYHQPIIELPVWNTSATLPGFTVKRWVQNILFKNSNGDC